METESCLQEFKNVIHSISPLSEKTLSDFLSIFSPGTVKKGDFFVNAGDYSKSFAFICNGLLRSYYGNIYKNEETKSLFIDRMFVLPLPSFIYRGPVYLNYEALTDINFLQAKYIDLENLSIKQPSVLKFMRILIDREWIIERELQESGKHIYNEKTRLRIFHEKFSSYITLIEPSIISSFLNIPVRQVEKFLKERIGIDKV